MCKHSKRTKRKIKSAKNIFCGQQSPKEVAECANCFPILARSLLHPPKAKLHPFYKLDIQIQNKNISLAMSIDKEKLLKGYLCQGLTRWSPQQKRHFLIKFANITYTYKNIIFFQDNNSLLQIEKFKSFNFDLTPFAFIDGLPYPAYGWVEGIMFTNNQLPLNFANEAWLDI